MQLTDRRAECGVLDQLLDAVRAGESRSLVVHGEPGAGKTVLLDYLAGRAVGCRVARAVGVQSDVLASLREDGGSRPRARARSTASVRVRPNHPYRAIPSHLAGRQA